MQLIILSTPHSVLRTHIVSPPSPKHLSKSVSIRGSSRLPPSLNPQPPDDWLNESQIWDNFACSRGKGPRKMIR